MTIAIVAGAVANKLGNAGEAWVRMTWAVGLARLGLEVYFLEQIDPGLCTDGLGERCAPSDSGHRAHFDAVMREFGLGERSALVTRDGQPVSGLGPGELADLAGDADLLVNMSGHLTLEPFMTRVPRRAYIDLDPGFTQFWHDEGLGGRLGDHTAFFTVGANVGLAGCAIPDGGLAWQPFRPPVLMEEWPSSEGAGYAGREPRFTTVASWRGAFGSLHRDGRRLGLKAHRFREYLDVPRRAEGRFEIALQIDPGDSVDLHALRTHGWSLVDPRDVVPDPATYRSYIQASDAEFSAAQEIYVETLSGWFSDRTAHYLASGRPALVEDTGFSDLPTDAGLLTFRTLEDAVAGAARIRRDYDEHSSAARALAEHYLDSSRVLGEFLDRVGPVERAA
jgi:hypothetical protein